MNNIDSTSYVQSYIANIAFPSPLDVLIGTWINERGIYDIEALLDNKEPIAWTAPRWAKVGDIAFFMHAKSARIRISAARTELRKRKGQYSEEEFNTISKWLDKGKDYYNKYGGKIFAVSRVIMNPEYDELEEDTHWGSRIYAEMDQRWILNNPVDIAEFRDFIQVSRQSSITPIYGKEYESLKELIISKNPDAPRYFLKSVATPMPLSKIDRDNWLRVTYDYRRSFFLEQQFRVFYVNYFLRMLGDRKTFYKECRCRKNGIADCFVDNIIQFNGKYLMIEVKLNLESEKDIIGQVRKYCNDDVVFFDSAVDNPIDTELVYRDNVLIIDTENVYLYDDGDSTIKKILSLDDVREERNIVGLRECLMKFLGSR